MLKAWLILGIGALAISGCTDTIVMSSQQAGVSEPCTYSLMYGSLHQCVANGQADGLTMANGPEWWTFDR